MLPFRTILLLVALPLAAAQEEERPHPATAPVGVRGTAAMLGMLPAESVAVAELAEPAATVTALRQALGDLPAGLREHFGVSAWAGLAGLWVAIDGDPAAFAATVASGGAVFALVPGRPRPGFVGIARPGDADATARWLQRFAAKMAREQVGGLVVFGSGRELVASTAARAGAAPSRWADADLGPAAPLRGAIDLAAIRQFAGADAKSFAQLDAGARFLLLPLAFAATNADLAQWSLGGGERLVLRASARCSVRGDAHGGLLAPPPAADAGDVPPADSDLGWLRLDRNLRALLAHPERFLRADEVLAVQGFLSIADAIDGARSSFVDDLLGGLAEPFTLHVLPVTAPEDGPPPRLQLPGFALLAKVAEPKAEAVMARVAQALALIANAERGQRGQGPFPLRAQSTATGHGFVAEPLAWRGPGAPPIEQGLSPTLWFENGHAVLASTFAAAQAVAARTYGPRARSSGGDRLVLRGPAWTEALALSRSVLELGRVLDEGEDQKAAARFFDILLLVLRAVREVGIAVDCTADRTSVEVTLERVR